MLNIKYCFTCGKSNLFKNISKFQYIMSRIVDILETITCNTMIQEQYSARWSPTG